MTRNGVRAALLMAGLVTAPVAAQQTVDIPAADKALPSAFEPVFKVGSMDGADWETFGEIGGVGFDGQGRLYVFDRQSSRVVVTDPAGKFLREVGKPGEGPGELRQPLSFVVLRDGSVVVADMGHRSYQIFGPDGAFQRMVPLGGEGGMIRLGDMKADPRGGAIFSGGGRMMVSMSMGSGARPELPKGRPIDLIPLGGGAAPAKTVVSAWDPPRPQAPQSLSGGGMRFQLSTAGPRTFEPGLYMGPIPGGGLAYSDTSTFAIKVTDPDGKVVRVIRRPFKPRPVTPAIQEAEKKRRLEELEAGGGPQVRMMVSDGSGGSPRSIAPDAIKEMMKGQVEQMQFFEELPVLMNLATGWGGKIWAVRRGDRPNEAGPIDVVTSAGQYVGTFAVGATELPAAFGPDGLVAFIERDEFDVPTVVVKRLPAVLR